MSSTQHLVAIASELGDDELKVLCRVAERLKAGQQVYGSLCFQSDRRDFVKEANEELLDACVYLACKTLVSP